MQLRTLCDVAVDGPEREGARGGRQLVQGAVAEGHAALGSVAEKGKCGGGRADIMRDGGDTPLSLLPIGRVAGACQRSPPTHTHSPKGPVEARRELGGVCHDRDARREAGGACAPPWSSSRSRSRSIGSSQGCLDGSDAAVHHVGGRDDVRAGAGVREGHLRRAGGGKGTGVRARREGGERLTQAF